MREFTSHAFGNEEDREEKKKKQTTAMYDV